MNGFLILDKPEGISSASCVYKLRSKLGIKRIGHCGTLDPLATGLLPICIGEATKFSNYASNLDKVYEVGVQFGIETDTGDITGKVISKKKFTGFRSNFDQILLNFVGHQSQIPPMYSAKKINGIRLYKLARKNITVKRNPIEISIKRINLEGFNENSISFSLTCSKGTYVRVLGYDIALKLNTVGYLTSLVRTQIGDYDINDSQSIKELENSWKSSEK